MVDLASREKDHAAFTFLQWYMEAQMQEEEKLEALLRKFDTLGRDKLAINEIDKMMGAAPSGDGEAQ